MSPTPYRAPQWVLLSLIAALIFAGALFLLARQNHKLEAEITGVKDQLVLARQDRAQAEGILEALRSPEAMRVTLTPSASPSSQPRLDAVFSPRTGRLVVIGANLAPVANGKTYQLWLLPKTGSPISAGTFLPDTYGHAIYTLALPEGTAPAAFTVTVEPKAGSAAPTTRVVLSGKVS